MFILTWPIKTCILFRVCMFHTNLTGDSLSAMRFLRAGTSLDSKKITTLRCHNINVSQFCIIWWKNRTESVCAVSKCQTNHCSMAFYLNVSFNSPSFCFLSPSIAFQRGVWGLCLFTQAKAFMPASIRRLSKITNSIAGLKPWEAGRPAHNKISPCGWKQGWKERGGWRRQERGKDESSLEERETIIWREIRLGSQPPPSHPPPFQTYKDSKQAQRKRLKTRFEAWSLAGPKDILPMRTPLMRKPITVRGHKIRECLSLQWELQT